LILWPINIGKKVAQRVVMILLVTPSDRASECAAALREATGEEVVIAQSLVRATTLLRTESYLAVVLDQYLLETESDQAATAIQHVGFATPVQVNFAISGMDRLAREVRTALDHRAREEARAWQAVMGKLHSELSGTLTALLLSTELTQAVPDLPLAAVEKLDSVHELVQKLRKQLETSSQPEAIEKAARA
jgi:hypothetical protein